MIVIEHQSRTLLVRVVKGHRTRARVIAQTGRNVIGPTAGCDGCTTLGHRNNLPAAVKKHVWYELRADPSGMRGRREISSGNGPLVRSSVADPRRVAPVKMQGGPVFEIRLAIGAHTCPHYGFIHRNKKVATLTSWEHVRELDPHRDIALGNDQRPQV